jgi:hypothetical protein
MVATSKHFRVDNGDMHLFTLESGRRLLIDIKIRRSADDPDDDTPDVAAQLRKELKRDAKGRLFVDAFLLTHPDSDHICGLEKHFHLGPIKDYDDDDDKIVIREMWSSPIVFRRQSRDHKLCPDACAWAKEARRRVQTHRDGKGAVDGERILIMGEDIDGKTDDLGAILVKTGQRLTRINGVEDGTFSSLLLAPLPAADEEEEELLSKNDSSVVMQLTLRSGDRPQAARYLLGGDAEVAIWERIWRRHGGQPDDLAYDVLIAPHHCSWHSLSWDSWSQLREKAQVSQEARKALGQALTGALVVSSSCEVKDNDNDPPCIRAKREYVSIVKPQGGEFRCVADGASDEPLVIETNWAGPKIKRVAMGLAAAGTGIGSEAVAHG